MKINFKGMVYDFMGVAFCSNVEGMPPSKKIVVYCELGRILWLDAKECTVVTD